MGFEHYLSLLLKAVFIENLALAFFLGMCTFLAISKEVRTAIGLGIAVIVIQGITVPVNNLIYNLLLKPGALAWLGVDASVDLTFVGFYQFHWRDRGDGADPGDDTRSVLSHALQRVGNLSAVDHRQLRHPGRNAFHGRAGLPVRREVVYGIGSGIGWAMAIMALAGIREKMNTVMFLQACVGWGSRSSRWG
ncbi:MAG: Na(+)-translocating NADH-quinone reductase subunit E [Planctomycetaceae bacterium]|nr:MAG: Na(+)-translocating NADH-quinone reductase subunit E [Planctomycetaceae bacterium]